MRPITFTRRESLAVAPADIAGPILDLAKWAVVRHLRQIKASARRRGSGSSTRREQVREEHLLAPRA